MCQLNTEPMRSQMGYLQVVVPPDIVDSATSSDVVAREGGPATLACAARGSPPPAVTWRRENSRPLPLPNGTDALWWEGGQLLIPRVSRLHSGAYLCIASNGVPPSVSKRVTLTVNFTPMIWIQNQLVGAIFGQSITLECHSEASPAAVNYWTREKGEKITNSEKYQLSVFENGYKLVMKLQINEVTQEDLGMYKCNSQNSLGDTDGSIKVYGIPFTTPAPTTTTTTTTLPTTVVILTTKGAKKPVKSRHNTAVLRTTSVPDFKNITNIDRTTKSSKDVMGGINQIELTQRIVPSSNISAASKLSHYCIHKYLPLFVLFIYFQNLPIGL